MLTLRRTHESIADSSVVSAPANIAGQNIPGTKGLHNASHITQSCSVTGITVPTHCKIIKPYLLFTFNFFQDSKSPTFSRMRSFMESQKDSVFERGNNAGVQRVINSDGEYAFLMESNSIQYQIERNCDLIQVI